MLFFQIQATCVATCLSLLVQQFRDPTSEFSRRHFQTGTFRRSEKACVSRWIIFFVFFFFFEFLNCLADKGYITATLHNSCNDVLEWLMTEEQ